MFQIRKDDPFYYSKRFFMYSIYFKLEPIENEKMLRLSYTKTLAIRKFRNPLDQMTYRRYIENLYHSVFVNKQKIDELYTELAASYLRLLTYETDQQEELKEFNRIFKILADTMNFQVIDFMNCVQLKSISYIVRVAKREKILFSEVKSAFCGYIIFNEFYYRFFNVAFEELTKEYEQYKQEDFEIKRSLKDPAEVKKVEKELEELFPAFLQRNRKK